jgi:hypothetical protein
MVIAFETPTGTVRRGQGRPVPIAIRHAINDFFSSDGEPYRTTIADPAAEAFYETAGVSGTSGWLAIRGISDLADPGKDDEYHEIASWHAAVVLLQLLPYLIPRGRAYNKVSWPES